MCLLSILKSKYDLPAWLLYLWRNHCLFSTISNTPCLIESIGIQYQRPEDLKPFHRQYLALNCSSWGSAEDTVEAFPPQSRAGKRGDLEVPWNAGDLSLLWEWVSWGLALACPFSFPEATKSSWDFPDPAEQWPSRMGLSSARTGSYHQDTRGRAKARKEPLMLRHQE